MTLVIKNPAVRDASLTRWGDYHFAAALQAELQRQRPGLVVRQDYYPDHAADEGDVVLVLRGQRRYRPGGTVPSILWVISHPASVTVAELSSFSAVCAASHGYQRFVQSVSNTPVTLMRQCTDPGRFSPPAAGSHERSGLLFVANSHRYRRDILRWALEAGVTPQLIGRHWDAVGLGELVEREYVENEELPHWYRCARFCLNDHWADMRHWGVINNRVFDALACGLPVVSDGFPELQEVLGNAVIAVDGPESLHAAVTVDGSRYQDLLGAVADCGPRIHREFSFAARAAELLALMDHLGRAGSSPSRVAVSSPVLITDTIVRIRSELVRQKRLANPSRQYFACALFPPQGVEYPTLDEQRTKCVTAGIGDGPWELAVDNALSQVAGVGYHVILVHPGAVFDSLDHAGRGALLGGAAAALAADGVLALPPDAGVGTWPAGLVEAGYTVIGSAAGWTLCAPPEREPVVPPRTGGTPSRLRALPRRVRSHLGRLRRAAGRAAAGLRRGLGVVIRAGEPLRRLASGAAAAVAGGSKASATWLRRLRAHRPRGESALRRSYTPQPDDHSFVLVRIIGNDLEPRHRRGQSRGNVAFILEHEGELSGCRRHWVLNRIVDDAERRAIIALLEEHRQSWSELSFDADAFCASGWALDRFDVGFFSSRRFFALGAEQQQRAWSAAYRHRNNALMHNNGARNAALQIGRSLARWVLPWDGNCFVTANGWQRLTDTVTRHPWVPFFVVPMQRVPDNRALLEDRFDHLPIEEPQLLFRADVQENFNPEHPYGRRPKVELLHRLGVPGPWRRWHDDPWEVLRRPRSPAAGRFLAAGWVARLASGVDHLEAEGMDALRGRGFARQDGISATVHRVMRSSCAAPLPPVDAHPWVAQLQTAADEALQRPPQSVVEKTELPPSGDPHDYYHPAPYWWPNPRTADGLPYVRRDGERVPGTLMYEADSSRFDRTRLQHLFDDARILTLAWQATATPAYAAHAAAALRRWFLEPQTRMNPHLRCAQVRWGHNNNQGAPTGIIEWKDLFFYLPAVAALGDAGFLSAAEIDAFRAWLDDYRTWLRESPQGVGECCALNNHGIYYDLQTAAIAEFLGDDTTLYRTFIRAHDRARVQFSPEGVQVHEMTRTLTAHYCSFTLQGWLHLDQLARRHGDCFGELQPAVTWMAAHHGHPWPYPQIEPFDSDRLIPLFDLASRLSHTLPQSLASELPTLTRTLAATKPRFHPHDGIRPFWVLG